MTNVRKAGLLALNGTKLGREQIQVSLQHIANYIYDELYIHICFGPLIKPYSSAIRGQYITLMTDCYNLSALLIPKTNVTVLHHYFCKSAQLPPIQCMHTDKTPGSLLKDELYALYKLNGQFEYPPGEEFQQSSESAASFEPIKAHSHCALGGTFDHIHNGHKVLLNSAIAIAQDSLTIGVTGTSMLSKKTLAELIASPEERIENVRTFVTTVCPDLEYKIVELADPFGPTITEPNIECIVVSEETSSGADAINRKRKEKDWQELSRYKIPMLEDFEHSDHQEAKISSSSLREGKLGTLIHPVQPRPKIAPRPYLIGLTGGIASGKSSVSKRLEGLGAGIINSDFIAHKSYEKGTEVYQKVVDTFGPDVVEPESGEIARRKLGALVFEDKRKLQTLNEIVWPATERLVLQKTTELFSQGKDVIFVEAALLLEAGWQAKLHEIWSCVIPELEALTRIMERGLTEKEAKIRLRAQSSNQYRVDLSNVVLCTLWDYSVTQRQIEKAWTLLHQRLVASKASLEQLH